MASLAIVAALDEVNAGRRRTTPTLDVMALVLTHNSRAGLQRFLRTLSNEELRPGRVLVVDNASTEPIDDLLDQVPGGQLLVLPENLGPAGGYAAGLRAFLDSEFEFVWILDDDCTPEPDALSIQLEHVVGESGADRMVLARVVDANTGEHVRGIGWWGVLIPKSIVRAVGVPNEELFWWTEDTEYLQWRIPAAGFETCTAEAAIVGLNRWRDSTAKPAWKYYYEARNQVHHRLRVQQSLNPGATPHHLKFRVRAWRAARAVTKLSTRAIFVEKTYRFAKSTMVARGALDGLRGRLGRTVSVDESHRPSERQDNREED